MIQSVVNVLGTVVQHASHHQMPLIFGKFDDKGSVTVNSWEQEVADCALEDGNIVILRDFKWMQDHLYLSLVAKLSAGVGLFQVESSCPGIPLYVDLKDREIYYRCKSAQITVPM